MARASRRVHSSRRAACASQRPAIVAAEEAEDSLRAEASWRTYVSVGGAVECEGRPHYSHSCLCCVNHPASTLTLVAESPASKLTQVAESPASTLTLVAESPASDARPSASAAASEAAWESRAQLSEAAERASDCC